MEHLTPPIPWQNSYSKTFVDLLATLTLDHVARRGIDTNDDGDADEWVIERQPHYALQSRAVQLLARELTSRLATGAIDYSKDPWDELYRDLVNTRGSDLVGAGTKKADQYLGLATANGHHGSGVAIGAQLSGVAYLAELASVIAAASPLAAAVVASASDDLGLDSGLAASIAADFAAARAGYLATLQARFPDRGFI